MTPPRMDADRHGGFRETLVRTLLSGNLASAQQPRPGGGVGGGGGGFATRISSNVRPQDPGGTAQIAAPGKELLHGQGPRPCRPGRCHSRYLQEFLRCWSRRPRDGVLGSCPPLQMMEIGGRSTAGLTDIVDSVVLPTMAGAAPPADVANVVAADAAYLADAGILSRPTLLGRCP